MIHHPLRLAAALLLALPVLAGAKQIKDAAAFDPTLDWHTDQGEAMAEARETGRPILLVFR